jgi:hypothetical protein
MARVSSTALRKLDDLATAIKSGQLKSSLHIWQKAAVPTGGHGLYWVDCVGHCQFLGTAFDSKKRASKATEIGHCVHVSWTPPEEITWLHFVSNAGTDHPS